MRAKVDLVAFLNVPWVRHGRSRDGYDCLGLAIAVRRAAGLAMPDYVYDQIVPCEIDRDFHAYGFKRLPGPRPWCIVTFVADVPPFSSHLGVVTGDGAHFIHTMSRPPAKSHVLALDNPFWQRRASGFWEL